MKSPQQSEIGLHAIDYWQAIRNRYGIILLTFFLIFMTSAVVTAIMPRKYEGKVMVEIERQSGVNLGQNNPQASDIGPQFLQTEFKVITSKETLNIVIDKLGLIKKWNLNSKDEAFEKLRRMVDADEERGTDIINIKVYSTDAVEAKDLANAIADSYMSRRNTIEDERVERALQQLAASQKSQEIKVQEASAKVQEIAQKYKITDLSTSGTAGPRGMGTDTGEGSLIINAKRLRQDAERQIQDYKNQLTLISNKEGDALISAAAQLQISDNKAITLYPIYLQMLTELKSMQNSGLGPNHPDIRQLMSKIGEQRRLLNESIETIRMQLKDKLKLAEDTLANVENQLVAAEQKHLDSRAQFSEYNEAKDNYKLQSDLLQNMVEQQEATKIALKMPKNPITLHEKATEQKFPAKPNVKLQLILGSLLGLILGIAFAFFLEYLDTSVKTLDDVERYLGVPVLAVIPKDVGILHKQSGLSPDAEAYRILRTNIEFNRKSADANAITVVSGGAGEGKSTTMVNLAYICAQGGYNTLMIDGDLRRPRLHTFFDINNSVGLTNYLTTELMLEDVILQTPIDNLYFMPSGVLPADAAGILNSRRMSELIQDVKNRFDLVLIDSPPILGVSDASVLASEVDLTMIVIQHRKLPRNMLLRVKQAIENVGGTVLGVVLNNVDVRSDSQYQYYTSYYTYYAPTNNEIKSRPQPAKSEGKESKPNKLKVDKLASKPAPSRDDEY